MKARGSSSTGTGSRTATATATAALVLALAAGCSLGVDEVTLEPGAAPLAIAGPRDGLVYTAADDEDPEAPGIQLWLRVDVDDADIERVDLAMPASSWSASDVVSEDLSGRRAAFFAITLDGGAEHPVVASAPAQSGVEVRAVLVAAPMDSGAAQ